MSVVNISMFAGESRTLRITVTDEESEDPIDITTATSIELQVKKRPGDADPPLISKSLLSGISLLAQSGDTLGQADAVLEPSDTASLRGLYYWDVVVTISGSRQYVVAPTSKLTIGASVNQP